MRFVIHTARHTWHWSRRCTIALLLLVGVLLALTRLLLPQIDHYRTDIEQALSARLGQPVSVETLAVTWWGWHPQVTATGFQLTLEQDPATSNPEIKIGFDRARFTVDPLRSLRRGEFALRDITLQGGSLSLTVDPTGITLFDDNDSNNIHNMSLMTLVDKLGLLNGVLLDLDRVTIYDSRTATPLLKGSLSLKSLGASDASDEEMSTSNAGTTKLLDATLALTATNPQSGTLFEQIPRWQLAFQAVHLNDSNTLRWVGRLTGTDAANLTLLDVPLRLQTPLVQHTDQSPRTLGVTHYWLLDLNDLSVQHLSAALASLPPRSDWAPAYRILRELAPSGRIRELSLRWRPADGNWQLATRLANLTTQPWLVGTARPPIPGISGLSGVLRATPNGGEFIPDPSSAHNVILTTSSLSAPAVISRFNGGLHWQRDPKTQAWRLVFSPAPYNATSHSPGLSFELGNRHLNAKLTGSVLFDAGGHPDGPLIDAQLAFADIQIGQLYRYLPNDVLKPKLRDWLQHALRSGLAPKGGLTIAGRVGRPDFFEARFAVQQARLDYFFDWPSITDLAAEVVFNNRSLTVTAHRGQVLGTAIKHMTARIDELGQTPLLINGSLQGQGPAMLRFVEQSPLKPRLQRHLAGVSVTDELGLSLDLTLPLKTEQRRLRKIAGALRFDGNPVSIARGSFNYAFERVRGAIQFTHNTLRADALRVSLNGTPAALSLESIDTPDATTGSKTLRFTLTGDQLSPSALIGNRSTLLERYLSGRGQWQAQLDLPPPQPQRPQHYRLTLRSNMRGIAVNLPGPLAKPATTQRSLTLQASSDGNQLKLALDYAPDTRALLRLERHDNRFSLERGVLSISPAALNSRLELPQQPGLTIRAALSRLELAGLTATDSNTVATPDQPPFALDPRQLPPLQLSIDALWLNGKPLGRLELNTAPTANGLRLNQLSLTGDGYSLSANGGWSVINGQPRSRLSARLQSDGLGQTLAQLGYPSSGIEQGATTASLSLRWGGDLIHPGRALSTLQGNVSLAVDAGRFITLDPGFGKALGLFNLSSLTRRLQLDFSDLFSEGLAFDAINGQLRFDAGRLYTEDVLLTGPTADIRVEGHSRLDAQRFDQTIIVMPHLGSSLAIASAIAGGPVVGAAVLVGTQLLKSGIDRVLAYRYRLSGSWDNPELTPVVAPSPINTNSHSRR